MTLRVEGISVAYDGELAVQDADLEVPDGQVLAVLGPSGCGKSTALRAIAGLEPLTAGRITWDGADLAGTPTHKRGFALMFQDGQLFGHLTVARNVAYALRLRRASGIDARVAELLELVGLAGYADRLPATLSGGERQRVALARSLAASPRLLLLDEPLSSLDADLRQRLATDLRDILRAAGTTTLMVTHDQEEAFAVADRLAVMRDGRVVQQGLTSEVWAAPIDAETATFLGYSRILRDAAAISLIELVEITGDLDPSTGSGQAELDQRMAVALRRSALSVDPSGPFAGTVRQVRATPDQVRLVVDVPELGEVDAVTTAATLTAPGQEVRLAVDPARIAVIPGPGGTMVRLN